MPSQHTTSTLLFLSREHGNFVIRARKNFEEQGENMLVTPNIEEAFEYARKINQKLQVILF